MEPVDTPIFSHQQPARVGVLVTNLGTPAAPTAATPRESSTVSSADTVAENAVGKDAATVATLPTWHEVLSDLRLSGSAQHVASHCELVAVDGSCWRFALDAAQANLFNERHAQAIGSALRDQQGDDVQVVIEVGAVTSETPAARAARLKAERLSEAEAEISEDPRVKMLLNEFEAEIQTGSVTVEDG